MTNGVPLASQWWRVRLRYEQGWTGSSGWLEIASWVEAVLPDVGGVPPLSVLPMSDGVIVALHVQAPSAPQAIARSAGLVEVVVGDVPRVLGRLVGTRVVPRRHQRPGGR